MRRKHLQLYDALGVGLRLQGHGIRQDNWLGSLTALPITRRDMCHETPVRREHDAYMPHRVAANCKLLCLEGLDQVALIQLHGLPMTEKEFCGTDNVLPVDHAHQTHLRVPLEVVVDRDHQK